MEVKVEWWKLKILLEMKTGDESMCSSPDIGPTGPYGPKLAGA